MNIPVAAVLALLVAATTQAAQQPLTEITTKQSRQDLRTAVNAEFAKAQSNFTEIYTALNGAPWLAQTTAPNIHNVFWIDTSGVSPVIKYWDGDSWEVAASGVDGTYTIPTASTETKGGVKIGARLTMTGEVLSADVQTTDISGKEDSLGNPSVNGYVLSSTTAGVRSWVEMTGGGTGISHATSDGAYYASRNGAWASLDGVFLTPTGSAAGLTNFPTLNQSTTGNAATATKLQTARTIGGVSFDGSANINLPGVNATGNQNTSGTSAGFSAQYIDWNSASGGSSIANKPTIPTVSDTAYGVGWNGDTGAASKNAVYDKIETISGGSMTYPGAGVPVSTGTAWGTSIILGTGVSTALGYAPDAVGGFLLANTYLDDPLISWDTATITETADSPVEGTNKIGVKSGVFQSYDVNMILWPSTISAAEVEYLNGLGGPLTTLLAAKLDDSQLDDTKGNGDTGHIWSADKVFDQLALKRSVTDERKEIGWLIKDSDVVTAVADGKQAAVIPSSMNGMVLVDFTCSVSDLNSAASGNTTVVLRRVRGATAVDMTSTGVTISYNEYTASDVVVDTANDDVATGDKIFVDINGVTSPVQKGLGCTADFARP